jgi:phosphoglycerate dehydrogenase-like enzyme
LNYDDVLVALNSDRLHAVGTDVYEVEPFPLDSAFLKHPKVVCTPHVAGVTELSYRNMAEIVADNVMRVVKDLEPTGLVNSISS